jgi:hypothetical protein
MPGGLFWPTRNTSAKKHMMGGRYYPVYCAHDKVVDPGDGGSLAEHCDRCEANKIKRLERRVQALEGALNSILYDARTQHYTGFGKNPDIIETAISALNSKP